MGGCGCAAHRGCSGCGGCGCGVGCGWQRGGYKQKGPGQKGGDRGQSDSSPHAVVADVRVNLEDEHPQPLPASWRALGNTAATSKNAAATREQGFQNVKDAAMLALRRRYPEAFSANRILPGHQGRARWCASWLNPSIRKRSAQCLSKAQSPGSCQPRFGTLKE
jgi:hypothetical protein